MVQDEIRAGAPATLRNQLAFRAVRLDEAEGVVIAACASARRLVRELNLVRDP